MTSRIPKAYNSKAIRQSNAKTELLTIYTQLPARGKGKLIRYMHGLTTFSKNSSTLHERDIANVK